ncbi:MAG: hypothetical protein KBF82_12885 [Chitinophagaceae bacterium]|nr:hypothetical protein [Chitinophagaceae bacterium]
MKSILVSSFLFLFVISFATAQEKPSPEAEAFFKKAMATINPRHVAWVKSTAKTANEKNMTDADVKTEATNWAVLGNLNSGDVEALCFLVMMQASKSTQEDLKAIMAKVKAINKQKQELRDMQSKMREEQQSMRSAMLDSFKLLRNKTIALQNHQNPDTVKFIRSGIVRKQLSKTDIGAMIEQTKNDLNSMNEMRELDQTRMQMYMDRRDKAMEALSNFMKKFSDSQENIIKNLK